MFRSIVRAAAAAATVLSASAMAASPDGPWQVKLLATGILPDGKITQVRKDAIGLPAGSQTKASDEFVPTLAIEYYAAPNVSIETICCVTERHVSGAGALAGASIIDHVMIVPATLTIKYHLDAGPIRPYIGAGPALFLIFGERPGATTRALGVTRVRMSNEFGAALQAGVDVPVNAAGLGVSLDAKRYFMKTTAHFLTANGSEALTTRHALNPWVLSAGVYYRF